MRSRVGFGKFLVMLFVLVMAPAVGAAQPCSVTIGAVQAIGGPGTPTSIVVSGLASGCRKVEVRLSCQQGGGTQTAAVSGGQWQVAFDQNQVKAAGCRCPGRVAVEVTCDGACRDSIRQSLECRPPASAPAVQHAVVFVCGKPDEGIAAPGAYSTAINVHNPTEVAVAFRKKFAVGLPEQRSGRITEFIPGRLGPDAAMEIDCPEIMKRTDTPDFVKGFAVIESDVELDVVAVYTAANRDGTVSTMDVERAVPRRREGCSGPDLIVESIANPVWDHPNQRSVIQAVIRNVGNAPAAASAALLRDPSTIDPGSGQAYETAAPVPMLAPGGSVTVTFHLPYWVFNPDASLEVTADYKQTVEECDETNNTRAFQAIG